MRLPGEALLEFRIEPHNKGQCILHQTALFRPRGLLGLIYWYAVLPDPEDLSYGEALDFWRVVGLEPDRCVSLRAEMRLPGEALLDFRIEPRNNGQCILHQTALFRPRGLLGLIYWGAQHRDRHSRRGKRPL